MNFYDLALGKLVEKLVSGMTAKDSTLQTGNYLTALDVSKKECKISVMYERREPRTFKIDWVIFSEADRIFTAMAKQVDLILIKTQNGNHEIEYFNHNQQRVTF